MIMIARHINVMGGKSQSMTDNIGDNKVRIVQSVSSSMSNTQMDQVFSYSTNWKEGKVNQMWIQQITPEYQECDHKYVAIAYNPEKNVSMVMSNPRNHYDTLNWVRNFCGSFSILN
jgi:hypothetical protein